MSEKDRIKEIVSGIPYPVMVVGSAVMVMHDIDRKLGDLDLFMATHHWFEFYHREVTSYPAKWPKWKIVLTDPYDPDQRFDPPLLRNTIDGLKVDIFFTWRVRENDTDMNPSLRWKESELIEGVCCSPIKFLLEWKRAVLRKKDLPDIEAILEKYPELDTDDGMEVEPVRWG